MSGGSFNYLYGKDSVRILESGMTDLDEMAAELEGLGHLARDPAERTRALQVRLRELTDEIDSEIRALEQVWHAVEWWRSCDYSKDQVFAELGAYRERQRVSRSA